MGHFNLVRCLVDLKLDEIDRLEPRLFVSPPTRSSSHTEKDTKKLHAPYEEGQATCRRRLEETLPTWKPDAVFLSHSPLFIVLGVCLLREKKAYHF